jgi:hypothetical protein
MSTGPSDDKVATKTSAEGSHGQFVTRSVRPCDAQGGGGWAGGGWAGGWAGGGWGMAQRSTERTISFRSTAEPTNKINLGLAWPRSPLLPQLRQQGYTETANAIRDNAGRQTEATCTGHVATAPTHKPCRPSA